MNQYGHHLPSQPSSLRGRMAQQGFDDDDDIPIHPPPPPPLGCTPRKPNNGRQRKLSLPIMPFQDTSSQAAGQVRSPDGQVRGGAGRLPRCDSHECSSSGNQLQNPGNYPPNLGNQQNYMGTQQSYAGNQQNYAGRKENYAGNQHSYAGSQQSYAGNQPPYPGNHGIHPYIPVEEEEPHYATIDDLDSSPPPPLHPRIVRRRATEPDLPVFPASLHNDPPSPCSPQSPGSQPTHYSPSAPALSSPYSPQSQAPPTPHTKVPPGMATLHRLGPLPPTPPQSPPSHLVLNHSYYNTPPPQNPNDDGTYSVPRPQNAHPPPTPPPPPPISALASNTALAIPRPNVSGSGSGSSVPPGPKHPLGAAVGSPPIIASEAEIQNARKGLKKRSRPDGGGETTPGKQVGRPTTTTDSDDTAETFNFNKIKESLEKTYKRVSTPEGQQEKQGMAVTQAFKDPQSGQENIQKAPWFWSNIQSEEGKAVTANMKTDGTFIVVPSKMSPDRYPYTIMVCCNKQIYHIFIREQDGKYAVGFDGNVEKWFPSVGSLLDHHQQVPLQLTLPSGCTDGHVVLKEWPQNPKRQC